MIQTIQNLVLQMPCANMVTAEQIQTKTRKREVVQARQTMMYLACKYTAYSLTRIGYKFGKKDHCTVLHAKKTINNLIDTNKDFREQIKAIEVILKGELSTEIKIDNFSAEFISDSKKLSTTFYAPNIVKANVIINKLFPDAIEIKIKEL
jgi:hypothetical protein